MRATAFLLTLALALPAAAQSVQLRPIDRATVRVISVQGLSTASGEGNRTRVRRVGADPAIGHGSGVAIGPRLVMTARHVVWGGSAWAVVPPGESRPVPAHPVYVDLDHDIAFVQTAVDMPHHVALPEQRPLRMSERVSASGYPLDLREPNPAAVSGEVSRVTRDGHLHLSMNVNPGNSGGPVVDGEGNVIAIVAARGRLDAGVEGLTIAEPLSFILAARARVPTERHTFRPYAADLARAVGLLARLEDDEILWDRRAEIGQLIGRVPPGAEMSPEHGLLFAGLAWNTVIAVMERENAPSARQLQGPSRQLAGPLYQKAVRLARHALAEAPHVRRRFPAARAISIGRTAPFSE